MIRCDSIDANVLPYSPHMCLKVGPGSRGCISLVGHICGTISCLACTTFVRCEDWLPFAAYGVQEFERNSARKIRRARHEHGNLSIEKNASPADLILHVKNVCFLVSAFFQG